MPRVKTEQKEPVLLNKTELCKSLDISTTAFDKWQVKPFKKAGRQTFYTVAEVVANRVANEKNKHKAVDPSDEDVENTIDYQRFRLTKAQADGQELKNEKDRKECVDVDFNTFVLSKLVSQIAPQLDKIPHEVKKKNPDIEQHILDLIKSIIIKNQNVIADFAEGIEGLLDEYLALSNS